MLFCVLFGGPAGVAAQGVTATISGTVHDDSGGVLPGVEVTITNVDTGITRTLVSDDGGRYVVPALQPGRYRVRGALEGFRAAIRDGIELTVGREAVVDLTLQIGSLSDEVTVTGDTPSVDTTTSAISGLADGNTIRALPLNGRDVMQLVALQEGVNEVRNTTRGSAGGYGKSFSIGGARPDQNNFYMDGLNINDQTSQTPASVSGATLGADTIREFRVLVNAYSAEFGKSSGGVVTAVTRSGTNELHGSAFAFLRDDSLDAANYFDPGEPPDFRRSQFGATAGGPIIRDRSFFFVSYEGLRQDLGLRGVALVPNALARQGIIPNLSAPGRPLMTVPIDPKVKPYLDLYPQPSEGGRDFGDGTAEYFGSGTHTTEEDYVLFRVDHKLSEQHSMSGRYTYDDGQEAFPNTIAISGESVQTRKQFLTIDETQIITSRLLNKVRFSYNRSELLALPHDLDSRASQLTFVPGQAFGSLGISGVSGLGADSLLPSIFDYHQFEVASNLDYTKGRHSMRAGVLITHTREDKDHTFTARGSYSFTSLANFLANRANVVEMMIPGSDTVRRMRQSLFGFYIQDDFKFRPNLTFNLGLRYEFVTVPTEADNKIATIPDPEHDATTTVGGPLWKNPSLKNFAPRIGFAWDPWSTGHTSIRGGYGIFYDQPMSIYYRNPMVRMPPFYAQGNMRNPPFPNVIDVFASGADIPQRLDTIQFDMNQPYRMQWNVNLQREILARTVVNVGYVGSRSRNMVQSHQNWNAPLPLFDADGTMHWPVDSLGRPTGIRRNPAWESIYLRTLNGRGSYHALVTSLNRRFGDGFQVKVNYTYSRNYDDNSVTLGSTYQSASAPQPFDDSLEWGPSAFDMTHFFSVNYVLDLPFGPGRKFGRNMSGVLGHLVGGWQVNGILTINSGSPFSAQLGFDRAGLLPRSGGGGQRPDLLPGADDNPILGGPDRYFDTAGFALPPAGYLGSLGRNTLTGPGVRTLDIGISKEASLTEAKKLQFRAEFFNVLNRANFGLPSATVFNASGPVLSAGRISNTTTTARQIQLGLKFIF